MIVANVEMAAAWDGAEGDRWAAHADRYEATAPGYWRAQVDDLSHHLAEVAWGQ